MHEYIFEYQTDMTDCRLFINPTKIHNYHLLRRTMDITSRKLSMFSFCEINSTLNWFINCKLQCTHTEKFLVFSGSERIRNISAWTRDLDSTHGVVIWLLKVSWNLCKKHPKNLRVCKNASHKIFYAYKRFHFDR